MSKIELNTKGTEILKYKEEYDKKSSNEIVKKAIETVVKSELTEPQFKIFKEATEKELGNKLLSVKKFQKNKEDYFNEKTEEIREIFNKCGIDYVLIVDKEIKQVTVRRKFGMSVKDIPTYFGVKDKKEIRRMAHMGFLQTFVNTRIRKVLIDIIDQLQTGKKESLPIEVSQAYRHEEFRSLFNVNVDIIMSYKEGMDKVALAKYYLYELVNKYKI